MKEEMPRKFKGIWIPKEIWLHPKLTPLQKCVVAEIDSLSDDESPCFASDAYLAEMFQVSIGRLKNILTELRQLGVIESCGQDSQNRRLLRLKIKVTESVTPVTESVTTKVTESVTPLIRERKDLEKRNEVHEAIALWLEAYKLYDPEGYDLGSEKKQKLERAAMTALVQRGKTPQRIGEVARLLFKRIDTAKNGELFYLKKGRSMVGFVEGFNDIKGEIKPESKSRSEYVNQDVF